MLESYGELVFLATNYVGNVRGMRKEVGAQIESALTRVKENIPIKLRDEQFNGFYSHLQDICLGDVSTQKGSVSLSAFLD